MWYTRTGDEGDTGLLGGERVAKDSPRLEALGDLDEAMSCIGLARAQAARAETKPLLEHIQRELIVVMAELAAPDAAQLKTRLGETAVASLEADIDRLAATVAPPEGFVLPGDSRGAAALDVARAVVRRAERRAVALAHRGEVNNARVIAYLNRLSSLLFLLARADDLAAGAARSAVVPW